MKYWKKCMNKPFLSIIVPIYNMEYYLKKCIDSIIVQSYKNFEIILVDNNSTEQATFDMIKEYESKYDNFKSIRLECPFNYSYIN